MNPGLDGLLSVGDPSRSVQGINPDSAVAECTSISCTYGDTSNEGITSLRSVIPLRPYRESIPIPQQRNPIFFIRFTS
ncbi:MAG TPA: hypothetical protein DDX92_12295 [Flavobacteriales bacterium]|nr:hypothetical protein [Flavobacteriales bacterium]